MTAALASAGAVATTITVPKPDRDEDLRTVDLVVAESVAAAEATAAFGVPWHRIFLLSLPPEPLPPRPCTAYAEELVRIAPSVAGLITDSELAREGIERVLANSRPNVFVFPPVAIDQICPDCTTNPIDTNLPPEVALLNRWHGIAQLFRSGDPDALEQSFVAARLLGIAGPWGCDELSAWRHGDSESRAQPRHFHLKAWSADAQQQAASQLLAHIVDRVPVTSRSRRPVLVAGYNLKFAVELAQRLDSRGDLDLTVDEWPTESEPSERTDKLLDQARSIFAEWVRPSTVWIADRKRPDQFLTVRLHRYELESRHPRRLDISRVDAVVYIAPLFGRRIHDELGWPSEKLVYIPNFINLDWLNRPKLPEARFGLGMVGVESMRKRFDIALDLLAQLRRVDPRFTLFVRSVLPWNNPFVWRHRNEREYAMWCRERIRQEPLLRGGVVFDPPGRDMARWYRQVGHILSTSDNEGSHMAPAEGMASGAVPVIRPWPGAAEIYDDEWIHVTTEDAVAAILEDRDLATWAPRSQRAQIEVARTHNPEAVTAAWADLLHGDIATARARFDQGASLS